MKSLKEKANEWSGLPVNAFGGVGDDSLPPRTISEIREERKVVREKRDFSKFTFGYGNPQETVSNVLGSDPLDIEWQSK